MNHELALLNICERDDGNLEFAFNARLAGSGRGGLGGNLFRDALSEDRAHRHEESERLETHGDCCRRKKTARGGECDQKEAVATVNTRKIERRASFFVWCVEYGREKRASNRGRGGGVVVCRRLWKCEGDGKREKLSRARQETAIY